MKPLAPDQIYVHPEVAATPLASRFIAAFPEAPVTPWAGPSPPPCPPGRATAVLLTEFKGSFLKPCPCTPDHLGCDYLVLNLAHNCPLGCSYCILQAYFDDRLIRVFTNADQVRSEIRDHLAAHPGETLRIGTGELSDSLAFDAVTGTGAWLVELFRETPGAFLELKTKSDQIDHLLSLNHGGKTVLAWSLNPPRIFRSEETGSAHPRNRLAAARRCAERGYPVAFHFDPMIHYTGWEQEYSALIDDLFDAVPADAIAWISLGTLRFVPKLKPIAEARHPESRIFSGEFIRGADGKSRYFIDLRLRMYRLGADRIRARAPGMPLYLCMESVEVWQKALGWAPSSAGALRRYLLEGRQRG